MPDESIRRWGDPMLRQVARPVVRMDELLRRQVARMRQPLIEADGAGPAATQVGRLRRVFVFRRAPDDPVEAIVNPRALDRSAERAGASGPSTSMGSPPAWAAHPHSTHTTR